MLIYNYNNRYILFNFASKKIDVYLSNEKNNKRFQNRNTLHSKL